uniref:Uncharacterized protein n=1 Tax=Arundo donax TaxID=35708 RepID=A0A0A8Y529_ARUDO
MLLLISLIFRNHLCK